jgi:hypothetical protein
VRPVYAKPVTDAVTGAEKNITSALWINRFFYFFGDIGITHIHDNDQSK